MLEFCRFRVPIRVARLTPKILQTAALVHDCLKFLCMVVSVLGASTDEIREQIEVVLKSPELAPIELRLDPKTAAISLKILKSKDGLTIMRIDTHKLRHTLDTKITKPVLVLLSNIQRPEIGPCCK